VIKDIHDGRYLVVLDRAIIVFGQGAKSNMTVQYDETLRNFILKGKRDLLKRKKLHSENIVKNF